MMQFKKFEADFGSILESFSVKDICESLTYPLNFSLFYTNLAKR